MDKFGSLDSMATKASVPRSSSRVGCGSATRMNTSEKSMLAQASVFMLEGFSFFRQCSKSRRRMKEKKETHFTARAVRPRRSRLAYRKAKTEAKPMFGFWGGPFHCGKSPGTPSLSGPVDTIPIARNHETKSRKQMDCTGRTTVASVSHDPSLEWPWAPLWLFGLSSCCDPGQWIQLSYDDQASILAPSHCPAKQSIEPMTWTCSEMFQLILATRALQMS